MRQCGCAGETDDDIKRHGTGKSAGRKRTLLTGGSGR
jgi:hypothetical protein